MVAVLLMGRAVMGMKWVETKKPCGPCVIGYHQFMGAGDCDCICHRVQDVEVTIEGDKQTVTEKRRQDSQ